MRQGSDDISDEVNGVSVEFAFFNLQVEVVVVKEVLEDLRHVVTMFGQVPGEDQIVDVDDTEMVEELPEHLVHKPLKIQRVSWTAHIA